MHWLRSSVYQPWSITRYSHISTLWCSGPVGGCSLKKIFQDEIKSTNTAPLNNPAETSLISDRQLRNQRNQDARGRSIYRQLLRESAYFPDAFARTYILSRIITRFRRYHNSALAKTLSPTEWQARRKLIRRMARQDLHRLERANTGNVKDFTRVLFEVYGRNGERRRRLMQDFKKPDPTEEEQSSPQKPTNVYMPHIPPKLKAIVLSQNKAQLNSTAIIRVKRPGSLEPSIPELNAWQRPTPQIRVKNMTADWWSGLLDEILPPLPVHEWLRLYDLATGAVTDVGKAPRQGGIVRWSKDPLELLATSRNSRMILWEDTPRELNFTFAQKAWAEVFNLCSVLSVDNGEWNVTWGYQALKEPGLVEKLKAQGSLYNFKVEGERQVDQHIFKAYTPEHYQLKEIAKAPDDQHSTDQALLYQTGR